MAASTPLSRGPLPSVGRTFNYLLNPAVPWSVASFSHRWLFPLVLPSTWRRNVIGLREKSLQTSVSRGQPPGIYPKRLRPPTTTLCFWNINNPCGQTTLEFRPRRYVESQRFSVTWTFDWEIVSKRQLFRLNRKMIIWCCKIVCHDILFSVVKH